MGITSVIVAERRSMKLGEKQELFSRLVMLLLLHVHALGYSVRGCHWMRCQGCKVGRKDSVHMLKLAFDIRLSISPAEGERPRVLTGKAVDIAHNKIHDYCDTIGFAKRISGDLGHYSLEHNGIR